MKSVSEMAVRKCLGSSRASKRSMSVSHEQWVGHWCRRHVEWFLRVLLLLLLLAVVPTADHITDMGQVIGNVASAMVCVNRCWVFVAGGGVMFSLIMVVSCGAAV